MEIERVVAEWLVLKCCDSTTVGVERVPLKSSVYGERLVSSSLCALIEVCARNGLGSAWPCACGVASKSPGVTSRVPA